MPPSPRSVLVGALTLLVGHIAAGILLYDASLVFHAFPPSFDLLVRVEITLALGPVAVVVVERLLRTVLERFASPHRASLTISFYRSPRSRSSSSRPSSPRGSSPRTFGKRASCPI